MTALDYRSKLIEAKQEFGQGLIGIEKLYAAADAYIAAIKEFKTRTKNRKLRVPDRGYVIRAIG